MHPDPTTVPPVCADPTDDYLFALASAAEARLIVTGDRKVQAVDVPGIDVPGIDVPGIDVMSPRAAADELDE
jgi:hypothetical protein